MYVFIYYSLYAQLSSVCNLGFSICCFCLPGTMAPKPRAHALRVRISVLIKMASVLARLTSLMCDLGLSFQAFTSSFRHLLFDIKHFSNRSKTPSQTRGAAIAKQRYMADQQAYITSFQFPTLDTAMRSRQRKYRVYSLLESSLAVLQIFFRRFLAPASRGNAFILRIRYTRIDSFVSFELSFFSSFSRSLSLVSCLATEPRTETPQTMHVNCIAAEFG